MSVVPPPPSSFLHVFSSPFAPLARAVSERAVVSVAAAAAAAAEERHLSALAPVPI